MSNKIILMAESGSDISPEIAKAHHITIVPMHVAFGGETRDDGSFPVTQMFEHYAKTRDLPRTSGCTPGDFEPVFEQIDKEHPDAQILYLAYSACTTCSMQSALIAAEGRTNFTAVDTKSVTAGQGAVVLRVAKFLEENPEATLEQAVAVANEAIEKVRMGFFPGDLEYLRAGGRVSNAAYLGIDKALSDVRNIRIKTVPPHLKDAHYSGSKDLGHGIGYKYAHDYPNHYVEQQYLPDELVGTVYYAPTDNGVERRIKEYLRRLKGE